MKKCFVFALLVSAAILFSGNVAQADTELGLRVSIGFVPGVDKVDIGGISTNYDNKSGLNLNPAFVLHTNVEGPVGFVGVFGVLTRGHNGEDSLGNKAELTAFGVTAAPGLAVRLSEIAHLEFKAEFGLGVANQKVPGFSDGSGPYVSIGTTAGCYFKVGQTFVLGGDLGYQAFASTGEADIGTIVDTEITGSGLTANFSFGWMF